MEQKLHKLLELNATEFPNKIAYSFTNENEENVQLTYSQLCEESKLLASELQRLSLQGKRCLLLYPQGLDFIIAFFACLFAGVVAVPGYPPKRNRNIDRIITILNISEATAILSNQKTYTLSKQKLQDYKGLFEVPWICTDTVKKKHKFVPTNIEDAFIQFTSGSTSDPKGVVVSHQNLIANLKMMEEALGYTKSDIIVGWLPQFHDMGLIAMVLIANYVGITCHLMSPTSFIRSPIRWFQLISKYKATCSGAPNFAFDLCVNKITQEGLIGIDLSSLRLLYNGAEPIRFDTLKNFSHTFLPYGFKEDSLMSCYGMAESVLFISGKSTNEVKYLTVDSKMLEKGRISKASITTAKRQVLVGSGPVNFLDQKVLIVNPDTLERCQDFTVGEIWVSGSHIAKGYFQQKQATDESFNAHLSDNKEGAFLRTGDLGFFDDRGELYVTGRLKDIIIIHGQNYYPQDIELLVEQTFKECLVGGVSAFSCINDEGKECVYVACEVVRSSMKRVNFKKAGEEINAAIYKKFGFPFQEISFLKPNSVPKTSSGKVQRSLTKQLYFKNELRTIGVWNQDRITQSKLSGDKDIKEMVASLVKQTMNSSDIGISEDLDSLGLDSIQVQELIVSIEDHFNISVPTHYFYEERSLKDIINLIEGNSSNDNSNRPTQNEGVGERGLDRFLKENEKDIPYNCTVVEQEGRNIVIDGQRMIDFASCNYLGFDLHKDIMEDILPLVKKWGAHPSWTRAVASPYPYIELEEKLAELMGVHGTVVFPSLAMLNIGVLPLLAGPSGIIIADIAAHHTIQEACELCKSRGIKYVNFKHNDLAHLEEQLKKHQHVTPKIIAVDGVYSMDVSLAPLKEISRLAKRFGAYVYVDDAHGFGVIGENPSEEMPYGYKGNGIVNYFNLDYKEDNIIYIAGLSKAYSSHAAFITCADQDMKKTIRMAGTYVFSGPVPVPTLGISLKGIDINRKQGDAIRKQLYMLTKRFVEGVRQIGFEVDNSNYLPIVFVVIGDIESTTRATKLAKKSGLLITPGIHPAVPMNRGGIRFSITSDNTEAQIDAAILLLEEVGQMMIKENTCSKVMAQA